MTSKYIKYFVFAMLGLFVTSCSDDEMEDINYDSVHIINKELNEALKKKGFSFTEDGGLIQNELVKTTKVLNLSKCNLKTVIGLSTFESLEEIILSDNQFGAVFDFANLPLSVKKVVLSGNDDIVEFKNLAYKRETKFVAQRNFTSLVLPLTAKWNTAEIVYFASSEIGKKADIQLTEKNGVLMKYSLLRDIPDNKLKEYLKKLYPSVFDNETGKMDLSRTLTEKEDLIIYEEIDNLEGVEYIIGNPNYKGPEGSVIISGKAENKYLMQCVRPSKAVRRLCLKNINTEENLDLTSFTELTGLFFKNNETIVSLNLSESFVGKNVADTNILKNQLCLNNCSSLEDLIFPVEEGSIGMIQFVDLPKLKTIDLSSIRILHTIVLNNLPLATIRMPERMQQYTDGWGTNDVRIQLFFAFGESLRNTASIKMFLNKHEKEADIIDYTEYYITN